MKPGRKRSISEETLDRIKELLKEDKMTQKAIAEECGVSIATVSNLSRETEGKVSSSNTHVITLKSGGTIKINFNVNVLNLDKDESEFVTNLINLVRSYDSSANN